MRPVSRLRARLRPDSQFRASLQSFSHFTPCRRPFTSTTPYLADPRPPNRPSEFTSNSLPDVAEQREQGNVDDVPRQRIVSPWERDHGEPRRSFKQTLRQRQSRISDPEPEVLKPPPLPEWFLRGNVKLVEEGSRRDAEHVGGSSDGADGRAGWQCVDGKTGEVLFHVPYCPPDMTVMDKPREEKVSAEDAERMDVARDVNIPGLGQFGAASLTAALDGDTGLGFNFESRVLNDGYQFDPLVWTLLETEASIRAALSFSGQASVSSSHAASRTDIHLLCPDSNAHEQMDGYVQDIASVLQADLVRIDANDIADLAADYVDENRDTPGSFSALGYETFEGAVATGEKIRGVQRAGSPLSRSEKDDMEEDEDDAEDDEASPMDLGHFGSFEELRKALSDRKTGLGKILQDRGVAGVSIMNMPMGGMGPGMFPPSRSNGRLSRPPMSLDLMNGNNERLHALLDDLFDGPKVRRAADIKSPSTTTSWRADSDSMLIGPDGEPPSIWRQRAATIIRGTLSTIGRTSKPAEPAVKFEQSTSDVPSTMDSDRLTTILHVRDLKQITASRLGDTVIKSLIEVVRKRRKEGERVLIIGTSAQEVQGPLEGLLDVNEDSPFLFVIVPPLFELDKSEKKEYQSNAHGIPTKAFEANPSYARVTEINLRHVRSMMSRLGLGFVDIAEYAEAFRQLQVPGTQILSEKVLGQNQVQRLVLTAHGLAMSHARAEKILPVHVALATAILARGDHATHSWMAWHESRQMRSSKALGKGAPDPSPAQAKIDSLKKSSNSHESRLLTGVVDPQNIKTGFNDVHAAPETIEALKTLTTLSLQRPDAFRYGVLANDRLTGVLLYGPPGTGKTLLAKAVAKESSATVLEISGAQIYEKYVGEGEKMVRAVFSLAKKLSPCIVFIDEADAIFGSRSGSGNRNTHREIINQFLREWDGMDNNSVFMMVASNRPFDLDDAVLRRLPRRLLVDLPSAKDRESILGIHLRHESLVPTISLPQLAQQTPLYSGSDLKNLCVAAALAAVREENALLSANKDDKTFKLPERRVLTEEHFKKAVQEISASISEDMGSLTAIRKFDEQYGDRRGRRKKSSYGFGTRLDDERGESDGRDVRVRAGP